MNRYLQQFLSAVSQGQRAAGVSASASGLRGGRKRSGRFGPGQLSKALAHDQSDWLAGRADGAGLCADASICANRQRVSLEELAGETIIGFDSDLTIRREIDRVLLRISQRSARGDGVRQYRNDQAGHRDRRRREPAAGADRGARSRSRNAGRGAAGDQRTGSAAGHHSSPRQRLGSTARRFIELLRSESDTFSTFGDQRQRPRSFGRYMPSSGQCRRWNEERTIGNLGSCRQGKGCARYAIHIGRGRCRPRSWAHRRLQLILDNNTSIESVITHTRSSSKQEAWVSAMQSQFPFDPRQPRGTVRSRPSSTTPAAWASSSTCTARRAIRLSGRAWRFW